MHAGTYRTRYALQVNINTHFYSFELFSLATVMGLESGSALVLVSERAARGAVGGSLLPRT